MTARPRDSWRQPSSRSSAGAARPATLSSSGWQQAQQALVDRPLSATRACSRSPPRPSRAVAPVRAHQPSALAETTKSAAARPPRTQARERKDARRRTTAGTDRSARTIVGTPWERRGPRMPWRSSLSRRALPCRQKGAILCCQTGLQVRHFVSCHALAGQVAPAPDGSQQLLLDIMGSHCQPKLIRIKNNALCDDMPHSATQHHFLECRVEKDQPRGRER